jgi:hypothetical protein
MTQSDMLSLFTTELTLNYQSPLVGHLWQCCDEALRLTFPDADT